MKNKHYTAQTKTVLKINKGGFVFLVTEKKTDTVNPYRIYAQYYEHGTQHRKQIAKYGLFSDCLYHLYRYWNSIDC